MRIPLFPLHMVAFPGTRVPLHVFESRYRAMMEHVLAGDRRFGVACISRGMEVGGFAEVHPVGCLLEVEQVQRSGDGSMTIIALGTQRFVIDERLPDDPFPSADVTIADDPPGGSAGSALADARGALKRYLSVIARMRGEDVAMPTMGDDPVAASYELANALLLDPPERQRLLEAPDAAARLALVTRAARSEAILLEAVGPSVGRPTVPSSLN